MKVEIWSDVVCPFCYIGKRRFEEALKAFNHQDEVEVEWKSFQLNPALNVKSDQSLNEYLAEIKGISIEEAVKMNQYVTEMAKEVGLNYQLDQAKVANTLNAHRLLQFAKTKGKGDSMKEHLMQAYFIQGKDLNSNTILEQIALEIGLDAQEIKDVLISDKFAQNVEEDAYDGQQLGVRGVPFFVFDRKYGISGAQPLEVFERTLAQAYAEKS
ncbi:MAG: DsbA family oxidoreductase [Bacteroidia bacterium]|nr:DsbA family oxidoreductase [Bacteroidia bacterium]